MGTKKNNKKIFILLYFYLILFRGTRINESLINTYLHMMNVTQWEGSLIANLQTEAKNGHGLGGRFRVAEHFRN